MTPSEHQVIGPDLMVQRSSSPQRPRRRSARRVSIDCWLPSFRRQSTAFKPIDMVRVGANNGSSRRCSDGSWATTHATAVLSLTKAPPCPLSTCARYSISFLTVSEHHCAEVRDAVGDGDPSTSVKRDHHHPRHGR